MLNTIFHWKQLESINIYQSRKCSIQFDGLAMTFD